MNLTDLNLSVLQNALNASPDGLIRQVAAPSVASLSRCIKAGALERTGERVGRGYAWRLTESGRALLHAMNAHRSTVTNQIMRQEALANLAQGY